MVINLSTLSRDLQNDGTHRTLIPMSVPELSVMYYVSFLQARKEKVKKFLAWSKEVKKLLNLFEKNLHSELLSPRMPLFSIFKVPVNLHPVTRI